jgi:tRNA(Ile)-lysidine synthetase, N-terminal domain/tRNA(Ile)-lysidine synthetase, C-terminal domain
VSASPKLLDTPYTRRIEARVLEYIRQREVFRPGESVVVGLSGGPDSTALLAILSRLQGELGLCVTAAHFDHRLRSREEAAGDLGFATQVCRGLGVPLVSGRGDVTARARRSGETIEEAARNLRYRFMGGEARRLNAPVIAVGHTMDDQAETVLLHILRGSGLDGLAAMPPRCPWPFGRGPEIARPLLQLTRRDTERYCRESGIEPRHDPTNDLPIATRNRVRGELMPVLRSFNPRVEEALARLAEAAAGDAAFIAEFADSAWRLLARRDGNATVLEKKLGKLPRVVVVRILLRAFRGVSGGEAEINSDHLRRLSEAVEKKRARMSLPGGLVATVDATHLRIQRGEPRAAARIAETRLAVPGVTRAGEWTIEVKAVAGRPKPGRTRDEATLDGGAIQGALVVRSRWPGDRLRPLGLGGEKKLQDIFVDAKVPREDRGGVPVIADERGIVWLAGHCIDERVAVTAKTRRIIRLKARRIRVDESGRAR